MTMLVTRPPAPAPNKPTAKRGRKTDLERAQRRIELEQLSLAEKRAKPIDPLRKGVLWIALIIAGVILATSAVFSFATIAATAEWMMPAWAWLVWVVPGFIELFIIYFGIDAVISQANGRAKDSRSALLWMLVFSGVAVLGNVAHTISGWGDLSDWRSWVGVMFSALAPLGVVLVVKRTARLVFASE